MRIVKKIIIWTSIIVLVLVIQGVAVVYFFQDEIKSALTTKLNENLQTQIFVEEINISAFRNFPSISVEFINIRATESYDHSDAALFSSPRIALVLNLWEVYTKNYRVQKLQMNGGFVHIKIDAQGRPNYLIWNSESSSESTSLALENIQLSNVMVKYLDETLHQDISMLAVDCAIKGNFNDNIYDLTLSGDLQMNHFILSKTDYINSKSMSVKISLQVDNDKNLYSFKPSEIIVSNNVFDVKGTIQSNETTSYDLEIAGRNMGLQGFLALIPTEYSNKFLEYKSLGEFYFNLSIKGVSSTSENPLILTDFGIANGTIISNKYGVRLDRVNFEGTYTNGNLHNDRSSSLQISNFGADLEGHPIGLNLSYENFESPYLNISSKGTLDLNSLHRFIDPKQVVSAKGLMSYDVSLKGLLRDLKAVQDFSRTTGSGSLKIEHGYVEIKDKPFPIRDINASFNINNKNVEVNRFFFRLGKSDFDMSGVALNMVPYLLGSDSKNFTFNASMKSEKAFPEEWMEMNQGGSSNDSSAIKLPNGTVKVFVKDLYYAKFTASDITGGFQLRDKTLSSDYLSFNSMKGNTTLSGSLVFDERSIKSEAKALLYNIDVKELFTQCQNFGQDILTDNHLKGKLSATINYSSVMNRNYDIDLSSISVQSHVLIEEGELIQFEPLNDMAKYVDVNELKHLRFEHLENDIEINNQVIRIPMMEIKSNAMNLNISGTHSFNNVIDYKIRILLSELLAKKSKKANDSEFGIIEDDGTGRISLFLSMRGTVDDPIFSLDKKSAGQNIAKDLKTEKQELGNIFKKEIREVFGNSDKEKNAGEDIPGELPKSGEGTSKTSQDRKEAFDEFFKRKK